MVVRFVFKQQQPRLVHAVVIHADSYAASVDFIRLIEILQNALFFQVLAANGAEIHQAHGLIFARVNIRTQLQIIFVGRFDDRIADIDIIQNGAERGMTAMVGPIGVNHADFGNGRVALLRAEILLAECNVALVHRQSQPGNQLAQCRRGQLAKAFQRCHFGGYGVLHSQRLLCLQQCLAGFHGVDDVFFNFRHFGSRGRTAEQVNARISYRGALAAGRQLNALRRACRALVKLTGQKLSGKHHIALGNRGVGQVELRLAEHRVDAVQKDAFRHAFHVIAVQNAQSRDRLHA